MDFLYVLFVILVNIRGLFFSKTKTISKLLMRFKIILDESSHKPNKILVNKSSEVYNVTINS